MSRRGQATFGMEQLVRLALSVMRVLVLLLILLSVYLWWSSLDSKAEATAVNTLENFVNVVNSQQAPTWSTNTFAFLNGEYILVGFGKEQTDYNGFSYSGRCATKYTVGETACICLFEENEVADPVACEALKVESAAFLIKAEDDCSLYALEKSDVLLVTKAAC
jgi:hypothetical protein